MKKPFTLNNYPKYNLLRRKVQLFAVGREFRFNTAFGSIDEDCIFNMRTLVCFFASLSRIITAYQEEKDHHAKLEVGDYLPVARDSAAALEQYFHGISAGKSCVTSKGSGHLSAVQDDVTVVLSRHIGRRKIFG